MPAFFIIHSLLPLASDFGYHEGRRNSILLLLGMFVYVVLYVYLKDLAIRGIIDDKFFDTIFVGLLVLFLSDCFVMGVTYKNYFDRSIFNEIDEVVSTNEIKKYKYDEKTHKYIKKPLPHHEVNENVLISNVINDQYKYQEEIKLALVNTPINITSTTEHTTEAQKEIKKNNTANITNTEQYMEKTRRANDVESKSVESDKSVKSIKSIKSSRSSRSSRSSKSSKSTKSSKSDKSKQSQKNEE